MPIVTLVSTVHAERGVVSVQALKNILFGLRPEAIFLEIPAAAFPDCDNGTRANLESSASREYREATGPDLVPVDLPTPDDSYFRYDKYQSRRVEETSPDYRDLIDQHTFATVTHGFPYLNSEDCCNAWEAIDQAAQVAVGRLPDRAQLLQHLAVTAELHDSREKAMLKATEQYFAQHSCSKGVLLVGAAHRRSLIRKFSKPDLLSVRSIEWRSHTMPDWRGITTA